MKTAAVIISGAPAGDNLREVEIEPGTSAGDVLRALDLNGYLLSREGSAQAFAAEENVYAVINDGDKLRATPVAEVGAGVLQTILRAMGVSQFSPNVVVQRPPTRTRATVKPAAGRLGAPGHLRIERDRRALWEIRGWRRSGSGLVGAYRTPRGSFVGEVRLNGRTPEFYIQNPPERLLKGSHAACFRGRGDGRFFVHFGLAHPDIDAGIVAIEKLIARALERRSA